MRDLEGTDLYFPIAHGAQMVTNNKNLWLCRASKIFATSLAADPYTVGRSDTRLLKYSTYVALPRLTSLQMWAD